MYSTGWSIRLIARLCWHQIEDFVYASISLIKGLCCQHKLVFNLLGHPVVFLYFWPHIRSGGGGSEGKGNSNSGGSKKGRFRKLSRGSSFKGRGGPFTLLCNLRCHNNTWLSLSSWHVSCWHVILINKKSHVWFFVYGSLHANMVSF